MNELLSEAGATAGARFASVQAPVALCRLAALPKPIAEGGRNSTLTRLGGALRRQGLDEGALATALLDENARRCEPPLPDEEVVGIARSLARYDPCTRCCASTVPIGATPSASSTPTATICAI